MEGSGTCRDVCRELRIDYVGGDIRTGFDATNRQRFERLGGFDFIWLHPPYWNMVPYNPGQPRCLSNARDVDDFQSRLTAVLRNCRTVLTAGGVLALLIGDIRKRGRYQGLPFHAFFAAVRVGFWLAAPEIVRFHHGATSSKKRDTTPFIPRLHDLCFVLQGVTEPPPE